MDNSSTVIIGNLTRDPEFTVLAGGAKKATFGVASEKRWMKDGEWQSKVSFFNVVAWRDKAEMADALLEKGMRVIVCGSLEQRTYDDKDGNSRNVVEVTANELGIGLWSIESLVRRTSSNQGQQAKKPSPAPAADDAPF